MRRRTHGRRVGGPRSKRTRENVEMRATGWSRAEIHGRMLKGLYSTVGPIPKWAQLAYDCGWITLARFLQIPNEPGPSLCDLVYAESPLFKMLRREPQPETTTCR